MVRVVRLALLAVAWLPFPWRFSRMGLEDRAAFLAEMESSRFALHRDLLLLAKLLAVIGWTRDQRVISAVGFEARCAVRDGAPRPDPPGLGDLEPHGDG